LSGYLYSDLTDRIYQSLGRWKIKRCKNLECGALWMDPRPSDKEVFKLYVNYYTHFLKSNRSDRLRIAYEKTLRSYIKVKFGDSPSVYDWALTIPYIFLPGRLAAGLVAAMNLRPVQNGNLLEIGCGSGNRLKFLQTLGWNCKGLDLDKTAAVKASAKGLIIFNGRLEEQNLKSCTFDAIVSIHLIEHLPNPNAFFTEVKRILKPGGVSVSYTPNANSFGHKLFRNSWRGLETPRHFVIFTENSLKQLLQKCGYEKIQCRSSGRGASMLLKSLFLKKGKRGVEGVENLSILSLILAEIISVPEYLLSILKPKLGEELVVIAKKPF